MSSDHLIQHLQQDAPDVLQRLEPVIDYIYRTYLRDALDAPRKRWYVGLTTQYLVQHLLTVYHRRVGQTAVAPTVEAGSVDATLEKTVAESYEGTAWDAFVRRLARELCLAALDTLVQKVGTTGLAGMSVEAFTAAAGYSAGVGAAAWRGLCGAGHLAACGPRLARRPRGLSAYHAGWLSGEPVRPCGGY
jgi:hypothetical protein